MKIMVLDASGLECKVGFLDTEKGTFLERKNTTRNQHAESLFVLIESILIDSRLVLSDITHISAIVGPGSFTGLRASLAAAQGFQLTTSISVHGINLLELQAYLAFKSTASTHEGIVSVVGVPYTESHLYYQVFDAELVPITEISFAKREEIPQSGHVTAEPFGPCSVGCRSIAEYLVYKLSKGLPETPLVPIYSRSYTHSAS